MQFIAALTNCAIAGTSFPSQPDLPFAQGRDQKVSTSQQSLKQHLSSQQAFPFLLANTLIFFTPGGLGVGLRTSAGLT